MSIKNTNKNALSTAKVLIDQYRQKGFLPDVDVKAEKNNDLIKDIQAIDDKVLPGYDCDIVPQKAWGDVWGNIWVSAAADNYSADKEQDKPETTPTMKA